MSPVERRPRMVMPPLAAVLILAGALRLATLGQWPVWIDEAFTVHDAQHTPPIYGLFYHVMGGVIAALGTGEWAIRALPCALGLATIAIVASHPAVHPDRATRRWAASFLALSAFHLFWSQSARYYTMQSLFVLLAFLALDTSRRMPETCRLLLAAAATALAVACHPSGMFFVPAVLWVAALRLPRRTAVVVVAGLACLAAVTLAYYWPLLRGHRQSKGPGSVLQFILSYGFLTGPVLLTAAGIGFVVEWRRRCPATAIFAAVPAIGIAGMAALVVTTGYHAFATLPFVALLAARGCLALRTPFRIGLLAMVLLELCAGLVLYHKSQGMRPRTREAADQLAAARADGHALFATHVPPLAYYLAEGAQEEPMNLRNPQALRFLDHYNLDSLQSVLLAGRPVCVLVHPDDLQGWPAADRQRLEELIATFLPRQIEFPGSFGPKPLSLRISCTAH